MSNSEANTVIVDRYREAANIKDAGPNSYRGLRIHALAGLHEFISIIVNESVATASMVLDLAAGSGAMSLRLNDMGFQVHATDYVSEGFKLHDTIPFRMTNLNRDFAKAFESRYDALIASEIIEHLENPWHFARQAHSLLKPGGKVILSTPNVDSMASRIMFLTSGRFLWFEDLNYRTDGHITPLTQWQIEACFKEAGFKLVRKTSFGGHFQRLIGSPRLRLLTMVASRLLYPETELNNEIFVAVFVKSTPTQEL